MEIFLTVGAFFSIASVFPLGYLALRSVREARELRLIQYELARLMREAKETGEEVHELQREIRREQEAAAKTIEETKRTVEQVTDIVEQAAGQVVENAFDRSEPILSDKRGADARGLAGRIGAVLSLLR